MHATEKVVVYQDRVIMVGLMRADPNIYPMAEDEMLSLAIRYLRPESIREKDGKTRSTTNIMGGETDWFILPFTFGVAIGKSLVELKVTGMPGFNEDGYSQMVQWMIDLEELNDAMCY